MLHNTVSGKRGKQTLPQRRPRQLAHGHEGKPKKAPGIPRSCLGWCLPLVEEPKECLKFELRHAGEVDGCQCALNNRGADLGTTREGEHGTEDEKVLGHELLLNTEETILDLR